MGEREEEAEEEDSNALGELGSLFNEIQVSALPPRASRQGQWEEGSEERRSMVRDWRRERRQRARSAGLRECLQASATLTANTWDLRADGGDREVASVNAEE